MQLNFLHFDFFPFHYHGYCIVRISLAVCEKALKIKCTIIGVSSLRPNNNNPLDPKNTKVLIISTWLQNMNSQHFSSILHIFFKGVFPFGFYKMENHQPLSRWRAGVDEKCSHVTGLVSFVLQWRTWKPLVVYELLLQMARVWVCVCQQ